jgi:hypothetical protein
MPTTSQKVHEDLVRLAAVKHALDELGKQKNDIEARLVGTMKAGGLAAVDTTVEGESCSGTLVEAERVVYDQDALEAALDTSQWIGVTKTVIDTERLEAAVVTGLVDEQVVAKCSEVKTNKPYVKVTNKISPANLPTVAVGDGETLIDSPKPIRKARVAKPVVK